jgi:hypothetical protein
MAMACVSIMAVWGSGLFSASRLAPGQRICQEAATAISVLIFLHDSVNGGTILVDTVAAVNVYPHRGPLTAANSFLSGPDNRPILSWDRLFKKLCFGG